MTANSAFHGTRLNVEHIASTMERVVAEAESRGGLSRHEIAAETVFVSHETYTPARGGSAAAEIYALRQVFGDRADEIVIANTKGLTGHPMGVGIEDVVAVKALETGLVPPIPNVTHIDPELGPLNLSKGGVYPVRYALRLAAGFGSQIAMALLRWAPPADARHRNPEELGHAYRIDDPAAWQAWLTRVAGRPGPELEVVDRRLRIIDQGPVAATPTSPPPAVAPPVAPAPATVVDPAAPDVPATDSVTPDAPAPAPRPPRPRPPPAARARTTARSPLASSPWSPNRPATRPTCWTSTSISKPTWASTPSSRPRSSPPSASPTASNATTTSNSATTRPWPQSSAS